MAPHMKELVNPPLRGDISISMFISIPRYIEKVKKHDNRTGQLVPMQLHAQIKEGSISKIKLISYIDTKFEA